LKPSKVLPVQWDYAGLNGVAGDRPALCTIPLRALFRTAIEEGLLDRSPMASIRNLEIPDHLPDPFTREKMEAILTHLKTNASEQAWNWYEFAFGTGVWFAMFFSATA